VETALGRRLSLRPDADSREPFSLFLSDTTEPAIWLEEEASFWELRRRTQGERRIFYRHRHKNIRRKAGNIADFCRRWGAQYDHMVVLDADSLMTGKALVQLSTR
jgi:membrane glycosyltransferase